VPELPEVETVARDLRERLRGRRVTRLECSGLPLRMNKPVPRQRIERAAVGASVRDVWRRAKYIIVAFSSNQALLVHLGMSGRFEVLPVSEPRRPHTHLVFTFGGGEELRFTDPRRFGMVTAYPLGSLDASEELRDLGPDPLDAAAFTPESLADSLKGTQGANIKAFLLDQRRVAGIGNIYACEALYRAGIDPRARARTISRGRATRLHAAIRDVLEQAVQKRGTSFRDYVDSWGRAGENQLALRVFQREGEPCPTCSTPVRRIVQQARSTFFCPRCQTR
jgi:formamidopyrimidine-DNA glycosylase